MADGDVFIFNDPYDGGTHLSDFRLVKPIFRNGEVFCYLASVGHWHDVGGNVPGNYNPQATESFQEGMLIPPVKLFEAGVLKTDIVAILSANSRLPNSLYGDMNAQINALDLGHQRFADLLDEYGELDVSTALKLLRDRADRMMRDHLTALPDGTISVEDYLDNDGVTDDVLALAVDMTVTGDRLTIDFSRSSAACTAASDRASSALVASSSRRSPGSRRMARAMAICCRWPPDNWSGRRASNPSKRTKARAAPTRSAISARPTPATRRP